MVAERRYGGKELALGAGVVGREEKIWPELNSGEDERSDRRQLEIRGRLERHHAGHRQIARIAMEAPEEVLLLLYIQHH